MADINMVFFMHLRRWEEYPEFVSGCGAAIINVGISALPSQLIKTYSDRYLFFKINYIIQLLKSINCRVDSDVDI